MPMLDMPLEKLKTYMGSSVCPADFDEFWNERLKSLDSIDPKAEFIEIKSEAKSTKFYDLYFNSTKGARIHAIFARPNKIEGKIPAVLRFHGLSSNAGDRINMIPYVSEGFCMAILDSRGQGGKSEDVGGHSNTFSTPLTRGIDGDPADMLATELFLDTVMLARVIMSLEYVDSQRVGVIGGSQGGALATACAALVPEIKLAALYYPYMSDYRRVWEMDYNNFAYEGLYYYFKTSDPTHEREDEIFAKLGYVDIQNFAHRVKAEVMMATGLMDTVCPPSAQFAMFNKLNTKKSYVIYPDFGHEQLNGYADKMFEFMCKLS